ncbi:MAG: hypothetical protein RLZZ292_330 [Bacteroidota bacterium]|jgi:hypothetical protein
MVNELIMQKIDKMPILLQKEVDDFIDFLIAKHLNNTIPTVEVVKTLRPIGTLKGLVVHFAHDFDAPMEDFKDYM